MGSQELTDAERQAVDEATPPVADGAEGWEWDVLYCAVERIADARVAAALAPVEAELAEAVRCGLWRIPVSTVRAALAGGGDRGCCGRTARHCATGRAITNAACCKACSHDTAGGGDRG